ncbi:DUF4038 domain-containing protein [Dactylosporangium siamense]|uniref:Beta-glucosidase n=1 Tax=Dactylosporangium siamense TaxID=685454 RepID=A0A919UEU7_9ACTN|nr:DUF4038 domain-containing protein [Dactylosporangium siamense]GIG47983.1 beta-glucosidase [Dactylosporangium siamense]
MTRPAVADPASAIRPGVFTRVGHRLLRDGRRTFLLADTAWAAFVRAEPDEWSGYLALRRDQGFNAVLISVLPIPHDQSVGPADRHPFPVDTAGRRRSTEPDPGYLQRARRMVEAALEHGITPVLALVWNNYVPGTWGAELTPHAPMDAEQTRAYVRRALAAFAGLDVIYSISGDEAYADTAQTARYQQVLDEVRAHVPTGLVTAHPATGLLPPPALTHQLDLLGYQSGHDVEHLGRCPDLAGELLRRLPARPVLNLEPCYEAHGRVDGVGRHGRGAVRAAIWSSVLGGATAGVGYGAHGVWSWHRQGDTFGNVAFSRLPYPIGQAMHLDGAHDAALVRQLVELHDLFDLRPCQELLVGGQPRVRAAATAGLATVAVYAPPNLPVLLPDAVADHSVLTIDLSRRRPVAARRGIDPSRRLVLDPEPSGTDLLHLLRRR